MPACDDISSGNFFGVSKNTGPCPTIVLESLVYGPSVSFERLQKLRTRLYQPRIQQPRNTPKLELLLQVQRILGEALAWKSEPRLVTAVLSALAKAGPKPN